MANKYGVCPRCGSSNIHIINDSTTERKGFGVIEGCLGYICLGPIGLLCGMCGMGETKTTNKACRMCANCGQKFK